jgi:hypothetical protein
MNGRPRSLSWPKTLATATVDRLMHHAHITSRSANTTRPAGGEVSGRQRGDDAGALAGALRLTEAVITPRLLRIEAGPPTGSTLTAPP